MFYIVKSIVPNLQVTKYVLSVYCRFCARLIYSGDGVPFIHSSDVYNFISLLQSVKKASSPHQQRWRSPVIAVLSFRSLPFSGDRGGPNISKADQIFWKQMVWGTEYFRHIWSGWTKNRGNNYAVTVLLNHTRVSTLTSIDSAIVTDYRYSHTHAYSTASLESTQTCSDAVHSHHMLYYARRSAVY